MVFDIGTICVKLAGRDAGKRCVVVSKEDEKTVLIDGETRRRKCNVLHLEPTADSLGISEGASHEDVVAAFKEKGIGILISSSSENKSSEGGKRPRKQKVVKKSS